MAKTVFRQNEIKTKEEKFQLRLLHDYAEVVEEVVEEIPEYEGPTADDLRREAEEYKKQFELEKQLMLKKAEEEAEQIVKKAEELNSKMSSKIQFDYTEYKPRLEPRKPVRRSLSDIEEDL